MCGGNGKEKTAGSEVMEMTTPNNGATPRPKKKSGPIKDRSCTDIICLALFLVFIAGLVVISIFAYTNGNPRLLLYPVDSDGNRCGMAKNGSDFTNRTKLLFFDFTECFAARLKDPLKTFTSLDFSCPTRQICVESCPSADSGAPMFFAIASAEQKKTWPCHYDVTAAEREYTGDNWRKLVQDKKCAPYIVPGSAVFGRCLPGESDQLLDFTKRMVNESLKGGDEGVNSTTPAGTFKAALSKFIGDLMDFQGSVDKLMADFANSWIFLVILLCISCVVCFVWIVLMRWIAAPMVWFSLIAFIGIFGFSTYYCVDKYVNCVGCKNESLTLTTDIASYKDNKNTWLGLSIISAILLFLLLVTVIFLRQRIAIAVAVIKETSKAVGSMMSVLFFPIFPFALQLAVFAGWTATMLFLVTSTVPIFVVNNSTNATGERAVTVFNRTAASVANGRVCEPVKFAAEYGDTGAECIFSRDGPNPEDPLFSHIAGVTDNLDWAKVYVVFALLWLTNFVHALGEMTLAGAFASWYWTRQDPSEAPMLPLLMSFWRCFRYHLGTLAFGSLIIAIVQMIRIMLEYVDRKLKNNENEVAKFIMKCLKCFFWCLEKFIKFINRNAYIMCAVYGRHFCASAKNAFMLILNNCVRAVVLDKVVDFLLFIGKLAVIGAMGVLSFHYYAGDFNSWLPADYTVELHYYWVPVIIIIIATYFVSAGFFSVYAMGCDTLFLCFLEDSEQAEKNNNTFLGPKSLAKILGKPTSSGNEEKKTTGCCGCC